MNPYDNREAALDAISADQVDGRRAGAIIADEAGCAAAMMLYAASAGRLPEVISFGVVGAAALVTTGIALNRYSDRPSTTTITHEVNELDTEASAVRKLGFGAVAVSLGLATIAKFNKVPDDNLQMLAGAEFCLLAGAASFATAAVARILAVRHGASQTTGQAN